MLLVTLELSVALEEVRVTTAGRVVGTTVDRVERDSAVDRVDRAGAAADRVERVAVGGAAAAADRPVVVALVALGWACGPGCAV